jgi:hypothetical protein
MFPLFSVFVSVYISMETAAYICRPSILFIIHKGGQIDDMYQSYIFTSVLVCVYDSSVIRKCKLFTA